MNRPLPRVGAPRRIPRIPVSRHTLPNGITVAVVERRDLPIVALNIVIASGAELDMPGQAGRMSMTAEMLDEGTFLRGALAIAEEIDHLGADLSIQAGWDAITVSLDVMSGRFAEALDIVGDVVVNPAFPEEEYERKRDERVSALLLEHDEANVLVSKAMAAGVFGSAHPYGAPIAGTHESISRLDCADVHALYRTEFHAGNVFVVVVGDVATTAVMASLEARFNHWCAQPPTPTGVLALPAAPATRALLVDKPGAAQAELRVGHAAPERTTSDYFALKVLNTILGGSFTSRLNAILRERMGVTYGAKSRFQMRRKGGLFGAATAVATEAVARSAQVVVEAMARLQDERVDPNELSRAQGYVALGLPRYFETTSDIAVHLREQLLYGLPADYWETYVDRILAITADDVRQAAARHLQPDSCVIAVVADAERVQRALEDTGLGDIVPTNVPI